jgi:hypothetical protein
MAWQVPALTITAEAFLLTIVLGADSTRSARLVASALAFVSALVAMQLMLKHRYMERIDTELLSREEVRLGLPNVHAHLEQRAIEAGLSFSRLYLLVVRRSSFRIWMGVLVVFAVVAITLFGISAVDPSILKPATIKH